MEGLDFLGAQSDTDRAKAAGGRAIRAAKQLERRRPKAAQKLKRTGERAIAKAPVMAKAATAKAAKPSAVIAKPSVKAPTAKLTSAPSTVKQSLKSAMMKGAALKTAVRLGGWFDQDTVLPAPPSSGMQFYGTPASYAAQAESIATWVFAVEAIAQAGELLAVLQSAVDTLQTKNPILASHGELLASRLENFILMFDPESSGAGVSQAFATLRGSVEAFLVEANRAPEMPAAPVESVVDTTAPSGGGGYDTSTPPAETYAEEYAEEYGEGVLPEETYSEETREGEPYHEEESPFSTVMDLPEYAARPRRQRKEQDTFAEYEFDPYADEALLESEVVELTPQDFQAESTLEEGEQELLTDDTIDDNFDLLGRGGRGGGGRRGGGGGWHGGHRYGGHHHHHHGPGYLGPIYYGPWYDGSIELVDDSLDEDEMTPEELAQALAEEIAKHLKDKKTEVGYVAPDTKWYTIATPGAIQEEMEKVLREGNTLDADVDASGVDASFRRAWKDFWAGYKKFYEDKGTGISGWFSRLVSATGDQVVAYGNQLNDWRAKLKSTGARVSEPSVTALVVREDPKKINWKPILITVGVLGGLAVTGYAATGVAKLVRRTA